MQILLGEEGGALWEGLGKEAALRWKGVVKRVPHFAKTVGMATLFWKFKRRGKGRRSHCLGSDALVGQVRTEGARHILLERLGKLGRGGRPHFVGRSLGLCEVGNGRVFLRAWIHFARRVGREGHTLLEGLGQREGGTF